MPSSGAAPADDFEAFEDSPPEGRARRAARVYYRCARLIRSTADRDW
jgi:hypothetical protein